ncbi:MAG: YceI family protein [Gemmobacter sp.]
MNRLLVTTALALAAAPALAADRYVLDASHAQIVFSYDHLGYSTGFGMFSGFGGEILWDKADPAASSVTVAFPVTTMLTGWEARFAHFMSPDFFGGRDAVTFASTAITVTGENTADITGDLTMNGVTQPVTLAARLNKAGMHPLENREWAGFDASVTLSRSAFDLGAYVPFIGDAVEVRISIEAMKAD